MNSNDYLNHVKRGGGGGLHISRWIAFLVIAKLLHAIMESAAR